ncbi:general secretion pathway protein GspB [Aquabacterium sp.]|uniref:general secretion pathway protein GspB n=1 Tax=Aquabacterium sp. TaxID=1872578 RepID=UPI002C21B625|nr:general secretion pathway protein GspB [Aquabacterium sp.]HSW04690.1 general secretion pathway protein GspB [Aquabacterium sp.]
MSYVLDALRRADAERNRGAVPDLHAQPVLSGAPRMAASPAAWRWTGLLLALVLAGALGAWWLLPRSGPAPAAAPVAGSAAAPAIAHAPVEPLPPAATPTATPAAAVPSAPLALPPVPRPALQPTQAQGPAASTAAASVPPSPAAAVAAASAPAAAARIPLLSELPEALRRSVPTLNIGGAMDSPQPTNRMLIVNGQVLHEGDQPLPGLTLRTIRLRSAVFDYKGTRFEISY